MFKEVSTRMHGTENFKKKKYCLCHFSVVSVPDFSGFCQGSLSFRSSNGSEEEGHASIGSGVYILHAREKYLCVYRVIPQRPRVFK